MLCKTIHIHIFLIIHAIYNLHAILKHECTYSQVIPLTLYCGSPRHLTYVRRKLRRLISDNIIRPDLPAFCTLSQTGTTEHPSPCRYCGQQAAAAGAGEWGRGTGGAAVSQIASIGQRRRPQYYRCRRRHAARVPLRRRGEGGE